MIWPDTAHPAFHKAAHLFGREVVVAPTDPATTQVDVEFVRDAINPDTAVVIASAGNYPYGTIDPIAELSTVVVEKNTCLHVDGCLASRRSPRTRTSTAAVSSTCSRGGRVAPTPRQGWPAAARAA